MALEYEPRILKKAKNSEAPRMLRGFQLPKIITARARKP